MAYDWRPTANRDATTDRHLVPAARREPTTAWTPKPPPPDISVDAAIDEFLGAAEGGQALNRSDRPYRPSALRDLRGILKQHVSPQIGEMQLRDVRRQNVQVLVDRLDRAAPLPEPDPLGRQRDTRALRLCDRAGLRGAQPG